MTAGISASVPSPSPRGLARWRREARRTSGWGGLLYILPALVILLAFEVWPLISGIWISLWRWDIEPVRFIGLDNYRTLIQDGFLTRDFRGDLAVGEVAQSLIVTAYYVLGVVPVTIFLSFVIAYLLFQGLAGQAFFRTVYFVPHVTASVSIALVFAWMFDAQLGVVNAVMEKLGLPTSTWLQDPSPAAKRVLHWLGVGGLDRWPDLAAGPSVALVVVIIFTVWSTIGYSIVVYLAGLTAIPRDLAEAARIDGASKFQIMRSITWPLLAPSTVFLVIFNTVGAFQAFTPIYAMTRNSGMGRAEAGGPLDTTLTITVYVFRNFYEKSNAVGYAAAVSLLLFLLMLAMTVIQFRLLGRNVHYQ